MLLFPVLIILFYVQKEDERDLRRSLPLLSSKVFAPSFGIFHFMLISEFLAASLMFYFRLDFSYFMFQSSGSFELVEFFLNI